MPIKLHDESTVLSRYTLAAVCREAVRAHEKHAKSGGSLLDPALSNERKLAALVEEVGEAAHALTYDADPRELRGELLHVANVALTWVQSMRLEEVAG